MTKYFYFKSLNKSQEKKVKDCLKFATAKLADGVINNNFPFCMTSSSLSVFDSNSGEVLFDFDITNQKVIRLNAVKKSKYTVSVTDAKKQILLIKTDGSVFKEYVVDQTNKQELNNVYVDLMNLSNENPNKEFSIKINGVVDPDLEKKPLVQLYPAFKNKIDEIVLEANKSDKIHPIYNESGVKIKAVNSAIAELSQKLKSNGLYTSEEFNTLVNNLRTGNISKEDFDKNVDQLIVAYLVRNEEFDAILKELKNSDEYKNSQSIEILNIDLDKLNLRHKYVYEKADKNEIEQEFYTCLANHNINQAKKSSNVSNENVNETKERLVYNYLMSKNIITGKNNDGEYNYNYDKYTQEQINKIQYYLTKYVSFEDFKNKVDQLIVEKKDKNRADIDNMNALIESSFKYSKMPEQLLKVKAEVEKGNMTYEEFLEAYYDWSKKKYFASEPEESKQTVKIFFEFFKDSKCTKPINLSSYNYLCSSNKFVKSSRLSNNCFYIKGTDENVTSKFEKKFNFIVQSLQNKDGVEFTINGVVMKVEANENEVIKEYGDTNPVMLKTSVIRDMKQVIAGVINDEEENEEFEVLEDEEE